MYIVYRTKNILNNKIYIGCHKTSNIKDGYLGSGKLLVADIKKHGKENFIRETIEEFKDRDEALDFETSLVTREFVQRDDTYNMLSGGGRDFHHINKIPGAAKRNGLVGGLRFKELLATDLEFKKQFSDTCSTAMTLRWKQDAPTGFKGKTHSKETKEMMSHKAKLRRGKLHACYGKHWIYNSELEVNKKVKKEELEKYLEKGWNKGRKMKF